MSWSDRKKFCGTIWDVAVTGHIISHCGRRLMALFPPEKISLGKCTIGIQGAVDMWHGRIDTLHKEIWLLPWQ